MLARFDEAGIDALITVGGDGSLTIGHHLYRHGLRVIGVPKTIDNDLDKTTATFGFDTAVGFATECIDRLFSTATSHGRVIVVEVMGRYAGWIALHSGMAAGAHCILIPEIPYSLVPIAATIRQRELRGAKFSIVVVAEGALPVDGEVSTIGHAIGQAVQLGGIGGKVSAELEVLTGKEARTVVLGHLLRGGSPTSVDRLLGLRFGAAAVRALEEGHNGVMVALDPPNVTYVPLDEATNRMKSVPPDCDTILTARDLGINFGDSDAADDARAGPAWPSTVPVEHREANAQADDHEPADAAEHLEPAWRPDEPLPRRARAEAPHAVGHERNGDEHQAEHGHLHRPRRAAVFDELGQDRGEEHDRLRIRRSDDEPVGHQRPGRSGDDGRQVDRGCVATVPDRLHPEPDEVGRAEQFDRGEHGDRAFDDRTDTDRDEEHLGVRAGGIAEHGDQRRATAVRHGAAHHEHHARTRDDDDRERQSGESDQ